jgi:hypothetical protein
MARREGGGRGGREIPGLHDALLAYARRFDDSWHREYQPVCGSCVRVEALVSGKPINFEAETIARAMFDRQYPARWDEFMHDKSQYTVTGDRLTPADD